MSCFKFSSDNAMNKSLFLSSLISCGECIMQAAAKIPFQIKSSLSIAIKSVLLGTVLSGMGHTVLAAEIKSTIDKTQQIQIHGGSLDQALALFAGQTGTELAYDPSLIAGKKTQGLNGQYTFEQGITQLLKGTGLTLIKRQDGTWGIIDSNNQLREVGQLPSINSTASTSINNNQVAQLPVITIGADSSTTEGTHSYTIGRMNTATKLNLSPRETPQTVKVFTREYLDDKNITSYQQLMDQVTGVDLGRVDIRANPSSRGFAVNYLLFDGNPMGGENSILDIINPDLAIFDHVEILKGANGLMTGAGNPSMGINFVRKRANAKEFTGSLDLSAGSWDNYSSSTDLSFPLNSDGSIRGRTIMSYQDGDSFQNGRTTVNKTAYSVMDMDLTEKTYLSLGASYQDLQRKGVTWGGLSAFYSDGTRTHFPRSTIVTTDWTHTDYTRAAFYANFKQKLFNDISFNLNSIYGQTKHASKLYGNWGAAIDKSTHSSVDGIYAVSMGNHDTDQNIDAYFKIPFNLLGLEQEVLVGAAYNHYQVEDSLWAPITTTYPVIDYDHLYYNPIVSIAAVPYDPASETTQSAVYISGKFNIIKPLKIVTGARLSNWKYEQDDGVGNREFNHQLTPYIGVIYDLNQNHSLYASYTDIFQPQQNKDVNGQYLDPIIGKQYETGIKGDYFNSRLNAALSLFDIKQDNVAEAIDGVYVPNTTEQAYRRVNGVESKGVELEIDGEITDNWNINLGIANFEAKDAKDNKVNTTYARTTANLFTKYKWDRWSLGGGFNYKSKFYSEVPEFNQRVQQNAYVLANLMVSYDIDQNIKAQLNINNLFDKTYYECVGSSICYGSPRNAILSLKYSF